MSCPRAHRDADQGSPGWRVVSQWRVVAQWRLLSSRRACVRARVQAQGCLLCAPINTKPSGDACVVLVCFGGADRERSHDDREGVGHAGQRARLAEISVDFGQWPRLACQ